MSWYELANAILKMSPEELQKRAIIVESGVTGKVCLRHVDLAEAAFGSLECIDLDDANHFDVIRVLRRGEYYLC